MAVSRTDFIHQLDRETLRRRSATSNYIQSGSTRLRLGYIDEKEQFPDDVSVQVQSANAYIYAQSRSKQLALTIHAGLAVEWFKSRTSAPGSPDADPIDRNRLSPKIGLEWSPISGTTLRAAAFSSVRRPFIRSETIEPTQVAGFNQFFTGFEQFYGDVTGTVSHRVGAAIDQAFSPTTFAGIEGTSRRLDVPSSVYDRDFTWREKTAHAYLYKTYMPESARWPLAGWQMAVSGEIEYERIERPQILTGSVGHRGTENDDGAHRSSALQ